MKYCKRLPLVTMIFFCLIIFSCKTGPLGQEFTLFREKAETIESYSPVWKFFRSGMEYTEGIIESPQIELYGLKIDLQNPAVEIVVNDPGQKTGIIPSIKTTSFAEKYQCVAAINTNPFNTSSADEGIPLSVVGITVSNGTIISRPNPQYAALVFYKNKKAEILWQKDITSFDEIEYAVGGFFVILEDGQFQDDVSDFRKSVRHPRSAAGLSADGRYLYLLAVNGRIPSSVGATERETAQILLQFCAEDAIIFDGGGSSSLALKFLDGKIRTVNTPVHMGLLNYERAVAACLGIRIH